MVSRHESAYALCGFFMQTTLVTQIVAYIFICSKYNVEKKLVNF